jgi:hypothetical protein
MRFFSTSCALNQLVIRQPTWLLTLTLVPHLLSHQPWYQRRRICTSSRYYHPAPFDRLTCGLLNTVVLDCLRTCVRHVGESTPSSANLSCQAPYTGDDTLPYLRCGYARYMGQQYKPKVLRVKPRHGRDHTYDNENVFLCRYPCVLRIHYPPWGSADFLVYRLSVKILALR